MIKTIFVSGFDSEVNPVKLDLGISRGQRTSIRSSGAPGWPSAFRTRLTLKRYEINSLNGAHVDSDIHVAEDSDFILTNDNHDSEFVHNFEIQRFSLRSSGQKDVPNYVVNSAGGETNRTRFIIQSGISPISDEASKEGFKTEITVRRQIPSDVSGGGGGGGDAATGNTQIWY